MSSLYYSNAREVGRNEVTSNVIIAEDKKTVVYAIRIGNGPFMQKPFEEYEKFFQSVGELTTATATPAPKKKFLQSDTKFYEKRKLWIQSVSQHLIDNHTKNDDVRRFFHIDFGDDDENMVDLGPSERKTACPQDFDFLTTIGKGSFGRVYQVRHKETKKIYAMKVLSKEHIRKKNEVKHVMAERNVLINNFKHPFLVSLHYSFQNKDKLYFVLDHLNGGELFSHLQREKHFSESRSRFYAAEIACALGYLHEKNIIYRDLKPENLLLDDKGYLVLADFGLCKEGMIGGKTTVTFCGTPEYLAPEIVLKKPYDKTVDWWCLGSVLYEMIFGLPPFYSKDHNEMYDRIVNQPLRLKHSISVPCSELITGLLQKDRTKRLGNKNDFKDIKDHPFFLPVDWDRLLNRELKAPFIPKVKNQMDVSQISKEFVDIQIDPSSLAPQHIASTMRDHDFENFTFVDTNRVLV
ncbi:unnamed protein product [Caenorhabditis angaria]|uniref:Serine/threonine-protein kinase sgk-1 n=1 Tax=Caenorhabditis angaria TaxID=860376 RepID=A0A9P1IZB1_9PELO|nr:unnamed protein product [Caenorhabditis angaria]